MLSDSYLKEISEFLKEDKKKKTKEIVYFVARPNWKNIFKIGRTTFLLKHNNYLEALKYRLKHLNNTSLRTSEFFEIRYAWISLHDTTTEKAIHEKFKKFRESPKREFFLINSLKIVKLLLKTPKKHLKIICSPLNKIKI